MNVFLGNVLAGLVSSIATVFLLHAAKLIRLINHFSALSGHYAHYTIDGSRLLDGITTIAWVGANVLRTHGKATAPGAQTHEWDGRLIMNTDVPVYGSGIYQYSTKEDCGIHEVQISPDKTKVFVYGMNRSHGNNKQFAYLWKRIEGDLPTSASTGLGTRCADSKSGEA